MGHRDGGHHVLHEWAFSRKGNSWGSESLPLVLAAAPHLETVLLDLNLGSFLSIRKANYLKSLHLLDRILKRKCEDIDAKAL